MPYRRRQKATPESYSPMGTAPVHTCNNVELSAEGLAVHVCMEKDCNFSAITDWSVWPYKTMEIYPRPTRNIVHVMKDTQELREV